MRTGDVVFRRGGGATSLAVIIADPDGDYSHTGIVVDSAGVKMIVHSVPDEPDYEGDIDRVKMDTPEVFFSNRYALKGEICRLDDATTAEAAAQAAIATYRRHAEFDHDYDSADTTKMYCTEFVVHSFHKAGCDLVGAPTHRILVPGINSICWLPGDVHSSSRLKSIITF